MVMYLVVFTFSVAKMTSRRELERFFDDADADQTGYLSKSELGNVLKKFGYNLDESQLEVNHKYH